MDYSKINWFDIKGFHTNFATYLVADDFAVLEVTGSTVDDYVYHHMNNVNRNLFRKAFDQNGPISLQEVFSTLRERQIISSYEEITEIIPREASIQIQLIIS